MTMKREKIHLGILRTGEYITLTWVDNRLLVKRVRGVQYFSHLIISGVVFFIIPWLMI